MTGVVTPFPGPFAQDPATLEAVIAHVHRELVADDASVGARSSGELDLLAKTAAPHLWGGRVTACVSVLALRDAREALRAPGAVPHGGASNRQASLDDTQSAGADGQGRHASGAPTGDTDQ